MALMRFITTVLLAATISACSTHATSMADVRRALLHNDLEEARARLDEAGGGTGDLLFALEDGLLLHYTGDYALSNARFEYAEREVEERYTKSITRAALSLVTSDLALAFDPNGIDNFLINGYKALNYLALGDVEGAWVEWRRLGSKLQFAREQGDEIYLDPPFLDYLAGLGLEADDPNAAYINFRLAEQAYRGAGRRPPPALVDDLVRLATALGFSDHLELYASRYGIDPPPLHGYLSGNGPDTVGAETAELVVLVEDGLVAPIEEVRAYIPITRERAEHADAGHRVTHLDLAEALAIEYRAGYYHGITKRYAKRVEIAYVLPVALPVYGRGRAAFQRMSVVAGPDRAAGAAVLEVSELQREAFEDRLLGIYAKTIARAMVKYLAAERLKEEAKEEGGETAEDAVGILANLINVVTERADTRAWLSLPHRIWMARLRLPPGSHDVSIRIDGELEIPLGVIDLRPGERRFLSHRVF